MPKSKLYKPTRADFEKFKAEFMRCVDLLNLNDWHVVFEFRTLDDSYAILETQSDQFLAVATFNSRPIDAGEKLGFDPKRTARHEAGHLFHTRLKFIGKSRYVRPDDFYEESERLARIMEKVLEK